MMSGRFVIQHRSLAARVWHTATGYRFEGAGRSAESDSVDKLRSILAQLADTETLGFWQDYRIITADGEPIERYKLKPGRLVRTVRRK
ncbi:hypothetical protein NS183_07665 [Microbacterium testaceum]|nr:hypothetical protein NS183_07665 [Microbacterium testaceum]